MEYITRGVCGQEGCRERRYYLDNGLWFCRRGHQQEGRQVEEDPEDFGTQGRTSRVKKAVSEKSKKTYTGRQAYRLFLQVYQLILWKQCYALVHTRGFPPQFEDVVRDLWALWLGTFEDKIKELGDDDEPEFFSSQATTGLDEEDEAKKTKGRKAKWPRLIDCIALWYLGAFLMRIPVNVADFHRMVLRDEVPYIRVVRIVPREMRDKLPQEFISILETTKIPQPEHIHSAVSDFVLFYHGKFDMKFPALNWPVLLYRFIKRLALPIEIYPAVKKLQHLLGFTFEYPTRIIGRRMPINFPELQLIALIVIATKLIFPFDRRIRHPCSAKEPAVQVIDWGLWTQIQGHFDNRETARGKLGKGNEIKVSEKDVFDMTPSQLDEYMAWYENSWIDTNRSLNPLAELFPLGPGAGASRAGTPSVEVDEEEAIDSMVQIATGQLQSRPTIPDNESDSDTKRPGSYYTRYRTEEYLPENARSFYEVTAKVVGVSLTTLLRVVLQAENKVTRWLEEQRRAELFGESYPVYNEESPGEMDLD